MYTGNKISFICNCAHYKGDFFVLCLRKFLPGDFLTHCKKILTPDHCDWVFYFFKKIFYFILLIVPIFNISFYER